MSISKKSEGFLMLRILKDIPVKKSPTLETKHLSFYQTLQFNQVPFRVSGIDQFQGFMLTVFFFVISPYSLPP